MWALARTCRHEAAELDESVSASLGRFRIAARAGNGLWGLCDHGLVSGVNFLTIVLVARAVTPVEFGAFVLAFTVILTTLTLQAALITRPHNVLGAVRHGDDYANYSTTAAVVQVGFTGVLTLLCVAAAGLAYVLGLGWELLLLALALAVCAWQLQEFGRRVLYTERRLGAVLVNDILSYGGQAVALLILWRLDALTATRALLTLAGAFAVGAVVLSVQLRRALSGRFEPASLSANWHFGKWLTLAETAQWFSTQFYIYLAAAIAGAVASGALKAGQTLLGPVAAFLAFFTSYLPIVFAGELERGGSLSGKVRSSLAFSLPVVVPYCVLAAVFAAPLLELVDGPEYRRYSEVVVLFAAYYVALSFSTVVVAALSARGMSRDLFVGQLCGAVLSLAIGWVLLAHFGPGGGVAGMFLSWGAAMALFLRAAKVPAAEQSAG